MPACLAHLIALADRIDRLNAAIGRAVAWLALLVVLVQFAVVLMRYVFGLGSIWLTEIDHLRACRAVHAGRGLDACARAAMCGSTSSTPTPRRARGRWIDLVGALLLLLPFMLVLLWFALPYVARSWAILETLARNQRPAAGVSAQDADPAVRAC